MSPLCQSTAFGWTEHIVMQVPQQVHFALSITGLWGFYKVVIDNGRFGLSERR